MSGVRSYNFISSRHLIFFEDNWLKTRHYFAYFQTFLGKRYILRDKLHQTGTYYDKKSPIVLFFKDNGARIRLESEYLTSCLPCQGLHP